jgi:hypothetical protein
MVEAFFFFIGGVQPKVKILDETPRRCPSCGLNQAYLKRVDHYISLFFIPLIRIKTGAPMLICNRCERPVGEADRTGFRPSPESEKTCRFCNKHFPAEFAFCPICGRRL